MCKIKMDCVQLCRCCLTVGLHKDLDIPYFYLDKREVYSDMLSECFNIVLSADKTYNMICESCITSLRSSLIFKQQVVKAEQDFIEWIKEKKGKDQKTTSEVKEELKEESENESDDYFLCDAEKPTKMKLESKLSKKRMKVDKGDLEDVELQTIKIEPKPESEESDHFLSDTDARDVTDLKVNKNKASKKSRVTISSQKDKNINIMWTTRRNNDKTKHKENLKTILQYSNATPFKNGSHLGYICGYCEQTYIDPKDLRNHTKEYHENERLQFKTNFYMSEFNVKLDVTDLKCSICDLNVNNLNDFKTHIVKFHNKIIHNDIKDHLQQFKLKKGDIYDCVLCSATYETFKMLKQHMNNHYSNYICNICNTPFATKRSLTSHKSTHIEGSFKCDHCTKIFSSKAKKMYHEKTKHLGERNISNCQYCDQSFRSYYQRNQHLIKVHNAEAKYKCNVCSKSYILKSLLMSHIKKNHLLERNFQCTECGYKFFSTKGLKAHMVKHSGIKKFSCEVCNKSYARKYTLREHMRIHNNDRRFKCDICSVTFVQKCSLKSHLLSNHGISMAASDIVST
ncbi:zinc finger protein 845 isoform X2 [Papilio machaon]|uniref:zinc finger protein 845 isoform X2 n=1 Tax=Papilio machaon TaxID=76193 RepID=UPI001E663EFC|nr:zinc finger protein 845 isoform X2 [Papilio machaon]